MQASFSVVWWASSGPRTARVALSAQQKEGSINALREGRDGTRAAPFVMMGDPRGPLSCFGCSGSLPVDPLPALGIVSGAGAIFERLAPFVIRKLALHR